MNSLPGLSAPRMPPISWSSAASTHFRALLARCGPRSSRWRCRHRQRVGVLTGGVAALVADQVDLDEPGHRIVPVPQVRIGIWDLSSDRAWCASSPSARASYVPGPDGDRSWPPTCRPAAPRYRRRSPAAEIPQDRHQLAQHRRHRLPAGIPSIAQQKISAAITFGPNVQRFRCTPLRWPSSLPDLVVAGLSVSTLLIGLVVLACPLMMGHDAWTARIWPRHQGRAPRSPTYPRAALTGWPGIHGSSRRPRARLTRRRPRDNVATDQGVPAARPDHPCTAHR